MNRYGLIGEQLGHSFSPQIHALLGQYPYGLYPLPPDDLPAFVQAGDLAGYNVTIPYKQAVIPFLQQLSDVARRTGSVNTVTRLPDGALKGDNTDYAGFRLMLGDVQHVRGRKALVLGSGGAAATVRAVLKDAGLTPVTISRSGPDNYQKLNRHRDAAVIVNATPVGMYPRHDQQPLSLEGFAHCALVLDLIYNPARTLLLLEAEERGIECRNGLSMLVGQAWQASRLWGQCHRGEEAIAPIVQRIARDTRNIALIGMPGCGKTTVGKHLAALTGRPLLDTDALIVEQAGLPIPQIFADQGEAAFRALETEALARAAGQSGAIIATGGGIVTQSRNLPLLRQNSLIIWLDRPLDLLKVDGRPLSQSRGVEALFAERAPLYRRWADHLYHNEDSAATAARIREEHL